MFDLYSVEQAEDAIVPTIVLSSTPPEQLVFRLYDVDTLRQPAHTILFDFFGRNFLQSFFLPGFPLLAPQRLLLRLCEISLPSTSNSKWTISSESNTFSTAGTSSSTFWVLFENPLPPTSNKWTTYSGSNTSSPPQGLLFDFPGFVRKLTPSLSTSGPLFRVRTPLPHRQRLLLPLSAVCSQTPPITSNKEAKHPPRWLSTTLPSRRPPSPGPMISTPSFFPRTLARKVTKTSPSLLVKTRQPRRRPRER